MYSTSSCSSSSPPTSLLYLLFHSVVALFHLLDTTTSILLFIQFFCTQQLIYFILSLIFFILAQILITILFIIIKFESNNNNQTLKQLLYNLIIYFPFVLSLLIPYYICFKLKHNQINNNLKQYTNLFFFKLNIDYVNDSYRPYEKIKKKINEDLRLPIEDWKHQILRYSKTAQIGFIVQSITETAPQLVIHFIYLLNLANSSSSDTTSSIYWLNGLTLPLISVCIKIITIAFNGIWFSYSISGLTLIFNSLLFFTDLFGTFATISWLCYIDTSLDSTSFFFFPSSLQLPLITIFFFNLNVLWFFVFGIWILLFIIIYIYAELRSIRSHRICKLSYQLKTTNKIIRKMIRFLITGSILFFLSLCIRFIYIPIYNSYNCKQRSSYSHFWCALYQFVEKGEGIIEYDKPNQYTVQLRTPLGISEFPSLKKKTLLPFSSSLSTTLSYPYSIPILLTSSTSSILHRLHIIMEFCSEKQIKNQPIKNKIIFALKQFEKQELEKQKQQKHLYQLNKYSLYNSFAYFRQITNTTVLISPIFLKIYNKFLKIFISNIYAKNIFDKPLIYGMYLISLPFYILSMIFVIIYPIISFSITLTYSSNTIYNSFTIIPPVILTIIYIFFLFLILLLLPFVLKYYYILYHIPSFNDKDLKLPMQKGNIILQPLFLRWQTILIKLISPILFYELTELPIVIIDIIVLYIGNGNLIEEEQEEEFKLILKRKHYRENNLNQINNIEVSIDNDEIESIDIVFHSSEEDEKVEKKEHTKEEIHTSGDLFRIAYDKEVRDNEHITSPIEEEEEKKIQFEELYSTATEL